ncbi:hypothetical protein TNCV_2327711 [Trichonephila clavipes]|nr:hypothetical protein TNCV_2327711 [Trichonephila clavipes]
MRSHWPWERTQPTTIVKSWLFVKLNWVLSLVGILGNKRADQKARQGVKSSELEVPLTLRRAFFSIYIDKYTAVTRKPRVLESRYRSNPESPRDCRGG